MNKLSRDDDDDRDDDRRGRRRRAEDEEEGSGGGLSGLNVAGIVLLVIGGAFAVYGLVYDTTVETPNNVIHNFGRLTNKICYTVLGIGLLIVGAVFFAHQRPTDRRG